MPFAELTADGIGEAGELAVLAGEVAIGAHDFVTGEVGIVGGEETKKALDEIRTDLSKAFCILLCWALYTNLHQFGVAFYEFLWCFVNLWKMRFGLTKGFVGIYRETLGFINLLEYGNA